MNFVKTLRFIPYCMTLFLITGCSQHGDFQISPASPAASDSLLNSDAAPDDAKIQPDSDTNLIYTQTTSI